MIRKVCFIIMAVLIIPHMVYGADDELNDYSFAKAEQALEKAGMPVSFGKIVGYLAKGNVKGAIGALMGGIARKVSGVIQENRSFLKQLILVAIAAAVFKNLSDAFFQGGTGETAFYVTYMIMTALMTNSFYFLCSLTEQLAQTILDFMKGMISAYTMAMVSVSGTATSVAAYEFYLMILYGGSIVVFHGIIPIIKVYFILKIVNHIFQKDYFSRLCDTLAWIVEQGLKAGLALVLGIQMIQSMILPAVDSISGSLLKKGISMIPGVGTGAGTVTNTLLGSAVIIKNSIGGAGIIFIVVLAALPLMQITVILLSYIGTSILLQPVSDRRIIDSMDAVIVSGKLFFRTLLFLCLMFILSIAMIAFTTNVNYYAG